MNPISSAERSFFDEKVGRHFIGAVKKTIESFFGQEPRMFEHRLARNPNTTFQVASTMRFQSHEVEASMVLALKKELALEMYSQMIGEKPPDLTPDVDDSLNELANIVYGMAKSPLVNDGFQFPMARPTSTRDLNAYLKDCKCLTLLFRVGEDPGNEFALIFVIHRFEPKADDGGAGAAGDAA